MSADVPLEQLLDEGLVADLLLTLDLAGAFVFAISGAMLAVRHRFDLFGVLALSFVASSAGGIARDLLIGSVPPAAIADWRYVAVAGIAGLAIFFWYSPISRLRMPILIFDAMGLALFAVSGAQKALTFGLNPLSAALLGMLTGIGGGIARDLLAGRIPAVLQRDLYAVAALVASGLVVIGDWLAWPIVLTSIAAALLCFGLRVTAIRLGWALPIADLDVEEAG